MKATVKVQTITSRVTAIIPETEEFIEHTIIISKMEDGVSLSAAGESIWIPPYALEVIFKEARKLNKI